MQKSQIKGTPEYHWHNFRARLRQRSVELDMTFAEWHEWWTQTGKWELRGIRQDDYCMARKDKKGPYDLTNVECITMRENRARKRK